MEKRRESVVINMNGGMDFQTLFFLFNFVLNAMFVLFSKYLNLAICSMDLLALILRSGPAFGREMRICM